MCLCGGRPGLCPAGFFSVSGTQCAAAALHRSGCFWGWRLVSVLNADPREAASWSSHAGVCPLLFSPLFCPQCWQETHAWEAQQAACYGTPGLTVATQTLPVSSVSLCFLGCLSLEPSEFGVVFPWSGAGFRGEIAAASPSPTRAYTLGCIFSLGLGLACSLMTTALYCSASYVQCVPGIDQAHSGCSLKSWPLAWFARGQYLVWRTRLSQAVAGPRTTSMRTSSLSCLENVGKVSVSGALTWSELQKERGRGERWRWADCTDLGALESTLGLRAGVRDRVQVPLRMGSWTSSVLWE